MNMNQEQDQEWALIVFPQAAAHPLCPAWAGEKRRFVRRGGENRFLMLLFHTITSFAVCANIGNPYKTEKK